jgi:hypothetical protein
MATTLFGLTSHWYYNTESGELTNGNNAENFANNLFGGLGWHELNIPGSATEAQAAAEAKKEFPTGKAPTTSIAQGTENQVQTEAGSLGSFTIGGVSGTNLVQRALKISIGGVLVLFGVIHLTGVSGQVASTVRKVPLPI